MAPGKDTIVYWGHGETSLRRLAAKHGFKTEAIYKRWRTIGRPERVYKWLFAPSSEWTKKRREVVASPPEKKEKAVVMPFSSEWGMLSATENTGAARRDTDDSPKSYRRDSMAQTNLHL